MTGTTVPASLDPTDLRLWMTDPHPMLRYLQDNDPVHLYEPAPDNIVYSHSFWMLTRHADVVHASRHPEIFSCAEGTRSAAVSVGFTDYDTFAMLDVDDPYHAWMRALVSKSFTAKFVRGLEPYIRETTIGVLEALRERTEPFDVVEHLSSRVPITVIGDVFGMPREDHHLLRRWTDDIVDMGDRTIDPVNRVAHSETATRATTEMFAYLENMQKLRSVQRTDDLISKLMDSEVDGNKLSWRQQRETFFILVTAGNETTRNTTTTGVLALAQHPDQRAALAAEPSLIPIAVEEMLRWGTVVSHFRRTATQDVPVGDKLIREGDWVVLYYTAANRDPRVFDDPDRFDIRRQPNDHLAFGGGGPHFCLGAPLARMQLRVMFEELLARYPNYRVVGEPVFNASNFFHGIKSLQIETGPHA